MTPTSKNTQAAAWDLSQTLDYQGSTIRFGIIGEGEPLVLCHGTPFSSLVWRRIAPWLAEQRRVYYWDMLGYGKSSKPDGDVSLGVQNKVLSALLDHWELKKPDVVAHDFGGTTALRVHILDKRDFRSLTLIDPVAIGPSGSPLVQAAVQHEAIFSSLPAYIHEAILRAYIGGATLNALRPDEMQLYLNPWLGAEGQKAFWRQIAQMSDTFTDQVEKRYDEIRCPVTILWGDKDEWIPIERGYELARRIPKAKFHSISEAKHLVQEDAPEAVIGVVLPFLLTKQQRQ